MTQQAPPQGTRHQRAQEAWAVLPHGGHDATTLHVQCPRSHHLATVYATPDGPVYLAVIRGHAHGSRDRVDEPHGATEAKRWFDWLDGGGDPSAGDTLPAWCDCGTRSLSRVAVLEWLAAGEHRVVVD